MWALVVALLLLALFVLGWVLRYRNNNAPADSDPQPGSLHRVADTERYTLTTTPAWDIPHVTSMFQVPDEPDAVFLCQREGQIRRTTGTVYADVPAMDPDFTQGHMEEGLMGSVVLPNTGDVYLSYTVTSEAPERKTQLVVSRLHRLATTLERLLGLHFREQWHHGGAMQTDGTYIYLSTGDGGPQGDPHNVAQDPERHEGKILRIDPTNPDTWTVIAVGLRNAWRFSLQFGRLYIADVGWDKWETIYVVPFPPTPRHYNFGWSIFEGTLRRKDGPAWSAFDPPVFEYPNPPQRGAAVIGGYALQPNLYLFADYSARLMLIEGLNDGPWQLVATLRLPDNERVFSFGLVDQEVYVCCERRVYRVHAT